MELLTLKEQLIYKEKDKIIFKKPNMYKVLLHNDDYTTMEFVVEILMKVFKKNNVEATKIMLDVHKKGIGIAGVYVYDIALTKLRQVEALAEGEGYPLKMTIEEE